METTSCASRPGNDSGLAINVGDMERAFCIAAGGIALLRGLSRLSPPTAVATLAGGALLYRGLTGHCTLYQALGMSTCDSLATNKLVAKPAPHHHGVTDPSLAATGESPSI